MTFAGTVRAAWNLQKPRFHRGHFKRGLWCANAVLAPKASVCDLLHAKERRLTTLKHIFYLLRRESINRNLFLQWAFPKLMFAGTVRAAWNLQKPRFHCGHF